jgi:hypothetical protein
VGGPDGPLSTRIQIYTTSYNIHGLPLVQQRFGLDGAVTDKYISEYKGDSLEITMTSYDGKDKLLTVSSNEYDVKGNQVYHKQVVKSNGRTIEQFRVYNSLNQNTELYNNFDGKKSLAATMDYDSAGNCIKRISSFGQGDKMDTTLSDFDAHGNIIRTYLKIGDSVRLIYEVSYNSLDLPLERRTYVQAPLVILSAAGEREKLQKADTRVARYTYDEKGLLVKQEETVNEKVTSKLEYEYLHQ